LFDDLHLALVDAVRDAGVALFARGAVLDALVVDVHAGAAEDFVVLLGLHAAVVDALGALVVVQDECVDLACFRTRDALRLELGTRNYFLGVVPDSGDALDEVWSVGHLVSSL